MKADAYRHAAGEGISPELQMLDYIGKYGAPALGIVLTAGVVIRMTVADNIRTAYRARTAADAWAIWAQENKAAASLLKDAEVLANG